MERPTTEKAFEEAMKVLWLIWVVGIAANSLALEESPSPRFDHGIQPKEGEWNWQNEEGAEAISSSQESSDKREAEPRRIIPQSDTNAQLDDDGTDAQRSVETVVDEILVSNRQGRNIEGFEQVYADPAVKNALQLGNDTAARSYIRDKLCSLGLMNCENIEGRRPYYSPHRGIHPQDIIYAQPVTIKPVGRPLPAIPVKRPYGPGKPLSPGLPPSASFASSGPPPEIIYGLGGGAHPPSISSFPPSISSFPPSSGLIGSYSSFKKPGPLTSSFVSSKPVYEVGPSEGFDYQGADQFIDKKQLALRPSIGSDSVQQHVHHHYHHGEASQGIATGGAGFSGNPSIGYGQGYGQGSSGGVGTVFDGNAGAGVYNGAFQDFDDYKKAFKVKPPGNNDVNGLSNSESASSYADRYPVYEKPMRDLSYGKSDGQKTGKYFSAGGYYSPNTVQGTNNDYAFGSSNNNYNYYENENEEIKNDFSGNYASDCVCVPYEQCPSSEHAGRKDDLFLPIDPRNLNKDIQAESIDTMIIVEGNGTQVIEDGSTTPAAIGVESARTKREATGNDGVESVEARKKINGEGRLDASDLDSSKLNVKPTWGISFGLPQAGAPYPVGPYGGNALSPYGGYGLTDQGINFGLVSVNPLVAVQFTKDEYGDKVVKPYVNFHVTPNRNLVHKLGHLIAHKKQSLYGNYGASYGANYAPHYPPKPAVFYEKPYYAKPHYPPYKYTSVNEYSHPDQYSDYYRDGDDYDYDYDDRPEYYYGSARANTDKTQTAEKRAKTDSDAGTSGKVSFPNSRRKRDTRSPNLELQPQVESSRLRLTKDTVEERQFLGTSPRVCGPGRVCCRRRQPIAKPRPGQCGVRYTQGINGRIKTPAHIDGDAEFGEYPWQVAILKKDPTESVYVCGGTLISSRHILTAAHCVKTYAARDLRVRLGEWDVNHDVEFYPYIERDVANINVHPEFYAGTLYNDIAILRIDHDVDFQKNPHISPACLPDKRDDFVKSRCWTTGWGKDAFGDFGKYQNILKEVDVPVVNNQICEHQMRRTRLGPSFNLHPGFICAGGEEGKDACKGDGGGPMVCERNGRWQLAGIVSWGIGCGQPGVPGVYSRVSYYLDWIHQAVNRY
ncbi:uncharacterized protein LOC143183288 [Calliopsis andreniformis]|uniref:uncharacterized protein LOC143183288 n=1 Tax=Calliopsis andreniformis TaxID=337506 RepID=UPI003FCECA58